MKKIPDHSKLVFKGILHDVYQWDQELYDGSIGVYEAIHRRDAVTIVAITPDNRILLNYEEQPAHTPFIALPGGNTEEGHSLLDNAKRELKEETGYESDTWEPWFTSDVFASAKVEWNNYFYIARNVEKTSEPHLDPGEKIEVRYITYEEFLELGNNPAFRNKDLIPILEKANADPEERKKLEQLLFTKS
jgi:ADP-ribose pyrophosphatase